MRGNLSQSLSLLVGESCIICLFDMDIYKTIDAFSTFIRSNKKADAPEVKTIIMHGLLTICLLLENPKYKGAASTFKSECGMIAYNYVLNRSFSGFVPKQCMIYFWTKMVHLVRKIFTKRAMIRKNVEEYHALNLPLMEKINPGAYQCKIPFIERTITISYKDIFSASGRFIIRKQAGESVSVKLVSNSGMYPPYPLIATEAHDYLTFPPDTFTIELPLQEEGEGEVLFYLMSLKFFQKVPIGPLMKFIFTFSNPKTPKEVYESFDLVEDPCGLLNHTISDDDVHLTGVGGFICPLLGTRPKYPAFSTACSVPHIFDYCALMNCSRPGRCPSCGGSIISRDIRRTLLPEPMEISSIDPSTIIDLDEEPTTPEPVGDKHSRLENFLCSDGLSSEDPFVIEVMDLIMEDEEEFDQEAPETKPGKCKWDTSIIDVG